ncbi:MAG: hypothetical protein ILP12_01715, partial [Lachnospiraceae bacterium]|nr:hypothetical protein [Lachnospiraceae bacterium]
MNARDLRAGLCAVWEKEWQGRPGAPLLEVYDTIGSTNDRAAELARSGAPDGSLVAADRQIRGRVRGGRLWETPPVAA